MIHFHHLQWCQKCLKFTFRSFYEDSVIDDKSKGCLAYILVVKAWTSIGTNNERPSAGWNSCTSWNSVRTSHSVKTNYYELDHFNYMKWIYYLKHSFLKAAKKNKEQWITKRNLPCFSQQIPSLSQNMEFVFNLRSRCSIIRLADKYGIIKNRKTEALWYSFRIYHYSLSLKKKKKELLKSCHESIETQQFLKEFIE